MRNENEMLYTEDEIDKLYVSSLHAAIRKLKRLTIYCGSPISFNGLGGWVWEQTIRYCIAEELKDRKLAPMFEEQVKIRGRARADLKIGSVALEVKNRGLFHSTAARKYGEYAKFARKSGLSYLFVTKEETYKPYRDGIVMEVGSTNAFFLDRHGEWKRFVDRIVELLRKGDSDSLCVGKKRQ
jgi:hypothetical protein